MDLGPIRITSPKTTLAGVGGALTALGGIISIFAGEGPVDWGLMGPLLSALVVGLINAFGNISARDNRVSSQDVGIRNEVPKAPSPVIDAIRRSQAP